MRSSALSMASAVAPIMVTSNFSSMPILRSDSAVLSAVCPPMVGNSAKPPGGVAFLLDDLGDDLRRDRLDIGGVGQVRIGHDGGRIGIDQHDPIALVLERLAGLRAGIIELAGLADDDRAGADDQDRGDVGPFGHRFRILGTKKGRAIARPSGRRRGSAPREGVLDQIRRGGNAAGLSCVGPRATLPATNMISAGGINADRP